MQMLDIARLLAVPVIGDRQSCWRGVAWRDVYFAGSTIRGRASWAVRACQLHRLQLARAAVCFPPGRRLADRRGDLDGGAQVYAELDENTCEREIKITDAQLAAVNLTPRGSR
jgi:hypothetical protein